MKTNYHHMQDALHYYLHHLIFKENDMKTFELTQEQINQLAEKKHAKELLQEFIPKAFETKLEVGKYYINKIIYSYCSFCVLNISDLTSKSNN